MNIKIENISSLRNFYHSNLFWIITAIAGSSYGLYNDIKNCIIHNYILPSILLFSAICIASFMFYLKGYIDIHTTFNKFNKWFKSWAKTKNIVINDTNIKEYLNECDISYEIKGDSIQPKISKSIIVLKYIFEISFWILLGLFIATFVCKYYNL